MTDKCKFALRQLGETKDNFHFFSDELLNAKELENFSIARTLEEVVSGNLETLQILTDRLFQEARLRLKAELKLRQLRPFREGRAAAQMKTSSSECWLFIDMQGNIITNTMFTDVKDFKDGKAEVDRAGVKWYIDRDGKKMGTFF
ncbi:WG repeat-containing protein [Candidatus Parcubacteria bacterium]|nr:WG repeat-containing protein [Candidatus Parcubacteria bacterium]